MLCDGKRMRETERTGKLYVVRIGRRSLSSNSAGLAIGSFIDNDEDGFTATSFHHLSSDAAAMDRSSKLIVSYYCYTRNGSSDGGFEALDLKGLTLSIHQGPWQRRDAKSYVSLTSRAQDCGDSWFHSHTIQTNSTEVLLTTAIWLACLRRCANFISTKSQVLRPWFYLYLPYAQHYFLQGITHSPSRMGNKLLFRLTMGWVGMKSNKSEAIC